MNSIFSVDDFSDPFWSSPAMEAAAAAVAEAAGPLGMTRSQSEWAFQKLLEEISASGSSISAASSATGRQSPPVQSQPSVSRPEETDPADDVVEVQKPHGEDNRDRYNRRMDNQGSRDRAPPSDPSAAVAADPDRYRAILKSKLDLACAAAVALRTSVLKPENLGVSADNQTPPAQLGSQSQVSPATQSSSITPSISVPPAPALLRKSDAQNRQAASGSSHEDSDDDELDTETTENSDPADSKRARRMLSNRESARRSRRRKQEQMNELETQVGQLRVEHSSLLKRLSDMNHKYDTAAVDNRILKADIETLRTKVKMAEETVKRVTGMSPLLLARSNMANVGMPFDSSRSDVAKIAAVQAPPSPNHILRPPVPNITCTSPNQRVENGFTSSTHIPPNMNPFGNAGGEHITEMPLSRHAASADHLQKQVSPGGMQKSVVSHANPCEAVPAWNRAVAKNKPQK